MGSAVRSSVRSRKAVCKHLATARRTTPLQWLKDAVVAALRLWRTIPGAMKGNEYAVTITGWKLLLVVVHQRVRRPVSGKRGSGRDFVGANTDPFTAVAAVLGRKN